MSQQQTQRHQKTQLKEIFCASNGYLSSKRVLGAIVLISCLVMIFIAASKEGITDNIKDIINVLIITSTALLGITSVTNIFSNNNHKPNKHKEEEIIED